MHCAKTKVGNKMLNGTQFPVMKGSPDDEHSCCRKHKGESVLCFKMAHGIDSINSLIFSRLNGLVTNPYPPASDACLRKFSIACAVTNTMTGSIFRLILLIARHASTPFITGISISCIVKLKNKWMISLKLEEQHLWQWAIAISRGQWGRTMKTKSYSFSLAAWTAFFPLSTMSTLCKFRRFRVFKRTFWFTILSYSRSGE